MGNLITGSPEEGLPSQVPVDALGRFKRYMLLVSADYETRPGTSTAEEQPCTSLERRNQRLPDMHSFCYLSPLQIAVCNRDAHLIPRLVLRGADVNARAVDGLTALHLASADLNKETMGALLDCGANVNLTMLQTQKSALHIAVSRSSVKCSIVLEAGKECVDLLLCHGANTHLWDSDGQEAIHLACRGGREDLVSLLIDYGADVNSLTAQGETPLFLLLEKRLNPKNAELLEKVLDLMYPLKLTNRNGRLPSGLCNSHELKERLVRLSEEVWPLQDICKFHIRKMCVGKAKPQLKRRIPTHLWNSITVTQEFSYASKLKRL